MTSSEANYLTVDLGAEGVLDFPDRGNLEDWLKELDELYSFGKLRFNNSTFDNHVRAIFNAQIQKRLTDLKQTVSDTNVTNNKILVSNAVSNLLTSGVLLNPRGKFGRAVNQLKGEDQKAAFFTLCLQHQISAVILENGQGMNVPASDNSVAKAIALYGLHAFGISYGLEQVRTEFAGFRVEADKWIDDLLNRGRMSVAQIEEKASQGFDSVNKAIDKSRQQLADLKKEMSYARDGHLALNIQVNESSKQLSELQNEYAAKFEQLAASHEAALKTDAAISFWETKETKHNRGQWLTGMTCLIFSFLSVVGAWTLKGEIPVGADLIHLPFWVPFLVVLYLVGVVWIGRVLVRLFLSQVGLKEDAAERATMAKTYIALVKEGAATEEHMAIVLQSLFRPSGKGLGLDDAAPQLPVEVILRRIAGDK